MNSSGTFRLLGRVALTLAVGVGAIGTRILVSATTNAVAHIDRTEIALADLSHDVADGHASFRGRLTAGSTVDAALAPFDEALGRDIARLRNLIGPIEQQAATSLWTQPLQGTADVRRIEGEWRAYVTAAAIIPAAPATEPAMRLRMLDLYARKLALAVELVRDNAAEARARTLGAVEAISALSSGLGGLLIAYLIWYPVIGGVRLNAGAAFSPRPLRRHAPMAFAHHAGDGWLPSASSRLLEGGLGGPAGRSTRRSSAA